MAKMLTVEEVAALLHVTRQTVWARIRAGEIPAAQLGKGRRYYIDEDELRKALEAKPKS